MAWDGLLIGLAIYIYFLWILFYNLDVTISPQVKMMGTLALAGIGLLILLVFAAWTCWNSGDSFFGKSGQNSDFPSLENNSSSPGNIIQSLFQDPREKTDLPDVIFGPPVFEPIHRSQFDVLKQEIGGLDEDLDTIFRRVFLSRAYSEEDVQKYGISHVKGMILYGKPGVGKTMFCRKMFETLKATTYRLISSSSLLNLFVGQSEKSIRQLFEPAEMDIARGNLRSLHIVVIDEFDAVFPKRGRHSSTTEHLDSMTNQLLAKMDGLTSLPNILVIGLTNRIDSLDDALLRPGRFEVKLEIKLPDLTGRKKILEIHLRKLIKAGKLADDLDLGELARLSDQSSGADLAGWVREAVSLAMSEKAGFGEGMDRGERGEEELQQKKGKKKSKQSLTFPTIHKSHFMRTAPSGVKKSNESGVTNENQNEMYNRLSDFARLFGQSE